MKAIEQVKPDSWPQLKKGIDDAQRQIEEKGFYTNIGEWHPDVNAVSVPFKVNGGGEPLYALNCGGYAHGLPVEFLEEVVGPKLVQLARTVSLASIN